MQALRHLGLVWGAIVLPLMGACVGRQARLCCGGWQYFLAKWSVHQHQSQTALLLNLSSATYQLVTSAEFLSHWRTGALFSLIPLFPVLSTNSIWKYNQ